MSAFSGPWLWTRSSMLRRWSLLCLSAIECVLHRSDVWSLVVVRNHEKRGQYSELCASDENDTDHTNDSSNNNNNTNNTFTTAIATCASANVRYSQIYTAGAFGTPVSLLVWGILLDKSRCCVSIDESTHIRGRVRPFRRIRL